MRTRSHTRTSIWRSGLLVLGLYAMLLQAFFGAVGGLAHAGVGQVGGALPEGYVGGVICSSVGGEAPSGTSHAHACICPALCHASALLAPAVASGEPVLQSVFATGPIAREPGPRRLALDGGNSARGPPHETIIIAT